MENSLWKYNTHNGSLDFLRSLHLTDGLNLASDTSSLFFTLYLITPKITTLKYLFLRKTERKGNFLYLITY